MILYHIAVAVVVALMLHVCVCVFVCVQTNASLGAASVHGTIPWQGEHERRAVLFGYYSPILPRRARL